MADSGQSTMRSLERAFDLLGVLESNILPMRLTTIAHEAGLAVSTTQRILAVLEARGLVERRASHYQLGVGIVPLAHAYLMGNRLSAAALPVLQELAAATGLTASLFVRLGFHRVVVARVQGEQPLRYVLPIGDRLPLHLGPGRVLAAHLSADDLEELLELTGDVVFDSGKRLTAAEFRASLERIRADGYLVARGERAAGISSISAPVLSAQSGVPAVVVVSGTDDRVDDETVPALVNEVKMAASAISRRAVVE